jgi:lipopolysaccharide transport system ATP-binding protein
VLNSGSLKQDLNQSLQGFLRSTAPSYDRESDDGHIWALKDVNFCIEQGETLGFVGRNGAGKSTLLKILSRITLPTTGTIKGIGRISSLLEVGTGFHPELTGRENVFLNGHILGMKRSEILRKFDEIVGFSGVEKFIDTPVKRYSSGMYVRLSFAVAAHMDPDILIIDEALAVGDAEFQTRCLDKMRTISTGEGRTVIFVSHNMQAVRQLCKRAIYLDHGTIAADGAPEQVIANYLTRENVECLKVEFPTPEVARGNKEIRFKYASIPKQLCVLTLNSGSFCNLNLHW